MYFSVHASSANDYSDDITVIEEQVQVGKTNLQQLNDEIAQLSSEQDGSITLVLWFCSSIYKSWQVACVSAKLGSITLQQRYYRTAALPLRLDG